MQISALGRERGFIKWVNRMVKLTYENKEVPFSLGVANYIVCVGK